MTMTRGPSRKVGLGEETLPGRDGIDRNGDREGTVLNQACHGGMIRHHKDI